MKPGIQAAPFFPFQASNDTGDERDLFTSKHIIVGSKEVIDPFSCGSGKDFEL